MKYSIIIPSYNEDPGIYSLIAKLRALFSAPIIIVDDGSDRPIKKIEEFKDIYVIRNKKNRGKGYSILKGLRYSSSIKCSHSITIDGDGQHRPENIQRFISDSIYYDLALGVREFKKPMPMHRIISNKLTSYLISKISKIKVRDSQSGFRMYKNSIIENVEFKETGFQFESEVFFRIKKDLKIKEVSIDVIYNDKKSHINNTVDTLRFIRLIAREIIYGK